MVCFHLVYSLQSLASLDGKKMLEIFVYGTVVHYTDQNWISKTVYRIPWSHECVMVCKIGFTNSNAKIALSHASMVVTYYIKLFRMGANRHNGILMSLLLLVAETIIDHMFSIKLYSEAATGWVLWKKVFLYILYIFGRLKIIFILVLNSPFWE